jgi:hypothetical protein
MLRCRPFSCHAWVPPLSTTALTHNARRAPLSGWSGLIGHKKWLAGSRLNRQHRQLRAARYPVSGQVRPALCPTKICCRLACRSGQHRSKGVNTLDLEVGGFGAVRGRPPSARLRIHLPTLILSCGPRWGRSTPDEGKPWLRRGTPVVVQDSPGTGLPADQRGLGAMAFLAGSAPLRQGCCLAHVVFPALCRPLRPGASVNPESTLTAMTIGVAAMSAHTRLIGSRCRVISASSSHCRGR